MLELSTLRKNPEEIIQKLQIKNYSAGEIIKEVLSADLTRRELQTELDNVNASGNRSAKEIGRLMATGQKEEAEKMKKEATGYREKAKELEHKIKEAETTLEGLLILIPNTPSEKVPAGKTAADNKIVYENECKVLASGTLLPHWELIKKYDIIDFETGNKISGPGFPVYKGKGARLLRALINYCLDEACKAGYQEMYPPVFVNEASAYATGQLPDKDGMMYEMKEDKLYAIPTAEVPLTNIYRDVILKEEEMPVKITGYTPCFRREAGSWGADVRGLNRLHQFDKVEIVQICKPENSYTVLEEMRNYVQNLVISLGLTSRTLLLCGGDMSFTSALTYDLEVFAAGQKKWLEVSSVSNFETFQANRLKLRYKDANKNTRLAHTLNGSALGLARILAAIIENYQTPEGIQVPEVLRAYAGFEGI